MGESKGYYVRVHTAPHLYNIDIRVGDTFPIVGEDELHIFIEILGHQLAFTKEKDEKGVSYATWLDIITEVY